MPTYNYKCESCENTIELLCSFAEFDEKNEGTLKAGCPECASSVHRDFSGDLKQAGVAESGADIYEWTSQKLPDGRTEVIPMSRRLRDSHRKILPNPKETWGK